VKAQVLTEPEDGRRCHRPTMNKPPALFHRPAHDRLAFRSLDRTGSGTRPSGAATSDRLGGDRGAPGDRGGGPFDRPWMCVPHREHAGDGCRSWLSGGQAFSLSLLGLATNASIKVSYVSG
jgi:hypothetical protein